MENTCKLSLFLETSHKLVTYHRFKTIMTMVKMASKNLNLDALELFCTFSYKSNSVAFVSCKASHGIVCCDKTVLAILQIRHCNKTQKQNNAHKTKTTIVAVKFFHYATVHVSKKAICSGA